jgi:RES domain-containing protein
MIVYRFAYPKFAADLSGTGARMHGGRWNPPGLPATYTSGHISLALLEVLANTSTLEDLKPIKLVEIDIPSTIGIHEIKPNALKKNWFFDFDYTQWMGQEILQMGKAPVIRCPSAIVTTEFNYMINPLHPDFKKIRLKEVSDFHFDPRLFKQVAR